MLFTAPCVQGLRMSKVVHPRNGPAEALPRRSRLPAESSWAYRVHPTGPESRCSRRGPGPPDGAGLGRESLGLASLKEGAEGVGPLSLSGGCWSRVGCAAGQGPSGTKGVLRLLLHGPRRATDSVAGG